MKKIILILIITTSSIVAFSQTRTDIKNITLNDVYATIGNDSIKNYIDENIKNVIAPKRGSLDKWRNLFESFILIHNKQLTIYLVKNYKFGFFSMFIEKIQDSLTVNDLNCLIKVALFKARIGERDTIINGEKVTILDGEYTTEDELGLETLQKTIGEIMQRRYKIKIEKPESLTQTTTPQWYLSIINKALKDNADYKKELKFLIKEIEEF